LYTRVLLLRLDLFIIPYLLPAPKALLWWRFVLGESFFSTNIAQLGKFSRAPDSNAAAPYRFDSNSIPRALLAVRRLQTIVV